VWGIWHGVGLFIHKVFSDRTRPYYIELRDKPQLNRIIGVMGTILTFQYVAMGWVWFALPDIGMSCDVFVGLFGL
jgi:alginate O-acetyltransferase complex protein AlgI